MPKLQWLWLERLQDQRGSELKRRAVRRVGGYSARHPVRLLPSVLSQTPTCGNPTHLLCIAHSFFLTLTGTPMAEVEAPLSPPAPQEEEILSEGSGPVDAQPETDGEHEATDVVEACSEPEAGSVAEEKPSEDGENSISEESDAPADDMPKENTKEVASPPTTPSKKITAKSSFSVKPSSAGKAGGPPTPLVKKVCCHFCPLPLHLHRLCVYAQRDWRSASGALLHGL